jgi:hypothetical protein
LQETRLTQRERMTALREALADARDREADDRECAADARERADDAWEDAAGPRDAGRLERVRRASAARSVANWRREQAAVDREAALTSIEALRVRYDC